jgi:NitT/TauT family transport system substrate-binding protein
VKREAILLVNSNLSHIQVVPTLHMPLLIVIFLAVAGMAGCSDSDTPAGGTLVKRDSLSIGVPKEPLGALVIIAAEKRYFDDEGLDVKIVSTYPSGKRALAGMLGGEVDMTISSEVPLVFQAFQRDDFRVLATIGGSDNEPAIVARKDRGIEKAADLRRKKIATQRGSAVHYFLHLILLRNGISSDAVEIEFLKAEQLPKALADGDIDAFSMREPFVGQAKELLGGNAVVFWQPGVYLKTMNLVALDNLTEERSHVVKKVLRALVRAETYARENRDDAVAIVAKSLEIDQDELKQSFAHVDLEVTLGQALIIALEDEARWAINNKLTDKTDAPDFLKIIAPEAIRAVKPSAATLID